MDIKLCECGCGNPVKQDKQTKKWNTYITGHNSKGTNNPNYGKPMTKEQKEKLSKAMKGKYAGEKAYWYGRPLSEEHKKKISVSEKGKVIPIEVREKMSRALKGRVGYWAGKKLNENHKRNIGIAGLGDKNGNWHGGIAISPYGKGFNKELKEQIRERDDYICQLCGMHKNELTGYHKKHAVHHIDYDKYNNNPTNLITLCNELCHSRTNGKREYWTKYFQDMFN